MVEINGSTPVTGPVGPVPFLSLFEGRDRLIVYQHMWHDGAPHQGQCEGCTTTAWHLHDATYLHAHGVSLAILTTGPWEEVPDGWPAGRHACWTWRTDADGTPTGSEASRPLPQWARPGATPVTTLGRHGQH